MIQRIYLNEQIRFGRALKMSIGWLNVALIVGNNYVL